MLGFVDMFGKIAKINEMKTRLEAEMKECEKLSKIKFDDLNLHEMKKYLGAMQRATSIFQKMIAMIENNS